MKTNHSVYVLSILCQAAFVSSAARAQHSPLAARSPGYSELQESLLKQSIDGQARFRRKRSVNGTPDSGRWTWMVKIIKSSTVQPCTGIPLNARWVLTAAHCTENETAGVLAVDYTANLGEQTEDTIATAIKKHREVCGSKIRVKRIIKHPESKAAKADVASGIVSATAQTTVATPEVRGVNDVALLELSSPLPSEIIINTPPVNFNKVDIMPNTKATMGGYGSGYGTNPNNAPHYYTGTLRSLKKDNLNTLTMPVKKETVRGGDSGSSQCKRLLPGNDDAHILICDTGAPFPSHGDSGGPLVSNDMIVGTLYGGDTYPQPSFQTEDGTYVFKMKRSNFEPVAYHKQFITHYAGLHWNNYKDIPEGQNFSPLLHYKADNSELPVGAVCRAKNTDDSWSYGIMTRGWYMKRCRFSYSYGSNKNQMVQVDSIAFQVASSWKHQSREAGAKIVWKKLHKKHLTPTSSSSSPIAVDFDPEGNPLYLCALIGDENNSTTHLDNAEFGVISQQSRRCKIGNKAYRTSLNKNQYFWVLSIENSAAHQ